MNVLLNFPFTFASFISVFNLEMQNFLLENHRMVNEHQPFC